MGKPQKYEGSSVREGNAEVDREAAAALMRKHPEYQTDEPSHRVKHQAFPLRPDIEANKREK